MAKKEKVVIKNEELIPTVIGYVDKRQAGLIYLTLVFIVLTLFVFYLPEITTHVEDYFNTDANTLLSQTEEETNANLYTENMSLTYENITLTDIIFSDNVISFNVVSDETDNFSLENNNIFLEVYNENDELIYRYDFADYVFVSNESTSIAINIESDSLSYFNFNKISNSDYPSVELNLDENDVQNLVCIKDNTIVTYYFSNGFLTDATFKDDITEDTLEYYTNHLSDYNSFTGLEAVIIEDEIQSTFYLTVDYSLYKEEALSEDYLNYERLTSAKVIAFELFNKEFDCN